MNTETLVCLNCGGNDIDDSEYCSKCDIDRLVTLSEYERWKNIKGTFQLFTGNDYNEPSVVIPVHLNKMGWIVADVINTGKTIFPNLSDLVEYDKSLYEDLLKQHNINYHTKALERLTNAAQ
jgi:hypothetical protein